ncbi:TPA: helix-turn-helix domain-containing protein [Klebsiella quasipneumoniae subsp. similipneumoniae]|nr:helix-turn-helix domain-containing protein [Klebsiella quasipneumoniae subsp. similipneumoniae]
MLVTIIDKEHYRLGIIQRVFDRALLQRDAADILKLSVRQVQRLVRLYRTDGTTALHLSAVDVLQTTGTMKKHAVKPWI